jgi:aspartyl-tRNA(Asn)/glutamyl-tRNA(Gln) amidotransferase subunit C
LPEEHDTETITDAEIEHLKRLARLHLTPDETERVRHDLNKILGYFARLSAIDTSGLEEMARPVALVNVLREDETSEGLSQEEALALGVSVQDGFFKVPRTVE